MLSFQKHFLPSLTPHFLLSLWSLLSFSSWNSLKNVGVQGQKYLGALVKWKLIHQLDGLGPGQVTQSPRDTVVEKTEPGHVRPGLALSDWVTLGQKAYLQNAVFSPENRDFNSCLAGLLGRPHSLSSTSCPACAGDAILLLLSSEAQKEDLLSE